MNNFKIAKNISTLFYLGYIKFMPGTFGSFVGLVFGCFFLYFFSKKALIIFIIISIIFSMYYVYEYQKVTGKKDRSEIIIDEFVGQLIPLLFINFNISSILFSFFLFRFFDIIKIFPANLIDRKFSNYFGVIFDDIIAGLQAAIILIMYYHLYEKF